jgi:hypothetical protein
MLSRTVTEIARRDYVKTPYTGNLSNKVQKPFGVDSEEALVEIRRRMEEEFFAEAYLRR